MLRSYLPDDHPDKKHEIGLEKSMQEYLETMWGLFDEIKRVLKPTGTVWVNLGDTYSGNMGFTSKYANKQQWHPDEPIERKSGLPSKTLLGIPDRFKIGMIDRGWLCRNEIIWWKRNAMPSSAKDRFTVDFEKVFFFTKNQKYYFETQYEPYSEATLGDKRLQKAVGGEEILVGDSKYDGQKVDGGNKTMKSIFKSAAKHYPKFGGNKAEGYGNPTYSGKEWNPQTFGRLKRTVWDIPTKPFSDAHFATYPEELVSNCIKAGCPEQVCMKCGKVREPVFSRQDVGEISVNDLCPTCGKTFSKHSINNKNKEGHTSMDSSTAKIAKEGIPVKLCNTDYKTGLSDCGCGAEFKPGIVLDPFFGSGTTGVAAMKLGRDWLGLELNVEYIKIAQKRLAPLMSQTRLT